MRKEHIKDWTVLIYAGGNNELEPEIWRSKIDAEKIGSSDNINVVMEIGRVNRQLARIIRPFDSIPEEDEQWTGVRRYYIKNSESVLISDLGKTNMADPNHLYNFITWGIKTYPSKHVMLILAGHGFSFVAAMTDLSQDIPYVMGIAQMCKALNKVKKDTGVKIDILALDMCHMNTIEILYELGKNKDHSVEKVITFVKHAPLDGIPYDKLLYSLEENHAEKNLLPIIESIIDNVDLNLIAIDMNVQKLKKIKRITSGLAYSYLVNKGEEERTPYDLLNNSHKSDPWYDHILKLRKNLRKLIIYHNNNFHDNIIDIATEEILLRENELDYFVLVYYNLSFCKSNYWLNVLTNASLNENSYLNKLNLSTRLEPVITPPMGIPKIIQAMNPSLKKEDTYVIADELFEYKKWDSDKIVKKLERQLQNLYITKNVKGTKRGRKISK